MMLPDARASDTTPIVTLSASVRIPLQRAFGRQIRYASRDEEEGRDAVLRFDIECDASFLWWCKISTE